MNKGSELPFLKQVLKPPASPLGTWTCTCGACLWGQECTIPISTGGQQGVSTVLLLRFVLSKDRQLLLRSATAFDLICRFPPWPVIQTWDNCYCSTAPYLLHVPLGP